MRSLKNRTAFNAKMKQMNKDTYKLRREVINVLYEAKKRGYNLPRIEVRIVEGTKGATAYAYLGGNVIHVDEKFVDQNITGRTLHEIGHAVFGIPRVKGCLLMDCEDWSRYSVNIEKVWNVFNKYYEQWSS